MRSVYVNCPICHKSGSISVPTYVFDNNYNGIVSIQVAEGDICKHQMLVSVDRNFCVRGIERIDFQVFISHNKQQSAELSFEDVISKFQTFATLMLLRSFILNYKVNMIVYATDAPTFCEELNKYFNNLLPKEWHVPPLISQIPIRDLETLKYDPQEYFILNSRGIVLNQPWGKRQFFLEESLTQLVASKANIIAQNTAMQEKIRDLFELAVTAVDYLAGKDIAYEDELRHFLDKRAKLKIKSKHLESICFLIERRFKYGPKIVEKIRSRAFDILSGALLT